MLSAVGHPGCSSLAGGPQPGLQNGQMHVAKFYEPYSIVVDASNNLYVADRQNNCIRKITSDGSVLTIAGSGQPGFADGRSTFARFHYPEDLAIDSGGNLIVADAGNHAIRRISADGQVTTIAGQGRAGDVDGRAGDALFSYPRGVALDLNGNIYVADSGNRKLKKIFAPLGVEGGEEAEEDEEGAGCAWASPAPASPHRAPPLELHVATTRTSGPDTLFSPCRLTVDPSGQVLISDTNRVLALDPGGRLATFAGGACKGDADGTRGDSLFNDVAGMTVAPDGSLLVVDRSNRKIKRITVQGVVSSLSPGPPFQNPWGVVVDQQGRVVVADSSTQRLWVLSTSFKTPSCLKPLPLPPPLCPHPPPCPIGHALLHDSTFADVTFEVASQKLPAHRSVLSSRSDYFRRMFAAGLSESATGVVKLSESGVDPGAFQAVLQYLYTDTLVLTHATVLEAMLLCHQYLLEQATSECLMYALTNINAVNAVDWYVWAVDHGIEQLRQAAFRYLLMNMGHLKTTAAEQLQKLQQRPELLMELLMHLVL